MCVSDKEVFFSFQVINCGIPASSSVVETSLRAVWEGRFFKSSVPTLVPETVVMVVVEIVGLGENPNVMRESEAAG